MTPVIGTVLLVALVGAQGAVAVAMMPRFDRVGCAHSVDDRLGLHRGEPLCPDARPDAWTYCQARPFESPACDGSVPRIDETGDWCRTSVGLAYVNGHMVHVETSLCVKLNLPIEQMER